MQLGQFIHAVAVQATFGHIGQQHGVIERRDLDVMAPQHQHVVFQVLPHLQDRWVCQQRPQQIQGLGKGNLRRRIRGPAVQVQFPRGHRALVAQGDVTSLSRMHG